MQLNILYTTKHVNNQIVDEEESFEELTSIQPAKKSQKRKKKKADNSPTKRKKVDNFSIIKQKIDIKSIVWQPSSQNVSCFTS